MCEWMPRPTLSKGEDLTEYKKALQKSKLDTKSK